MANEISDKPGPRGPTERVYGPSEHKGKWSVIYQWRDVHGQRRRARESYASKATAQRVADEARALLSDLTADAAVTRYFRHQRERGVRDVTIKAEEVRLRVLLCLAERDLPLPIPPALACRMVDDQRERLAPATHQEYLAVARRWSAWLMDQGWTKDCPFAKAKAKMGGTRGKPQLRLDEAKRFADVAVAEGSPEGVAACLALMTGARASEITERRVRDLDMGGTALCIPDHEGGAWRTKTKAGKRYLRIPPSLQPAMRAFAAGKDPMDWLWPVPTTPWDSGTRLKGVRLLPERGPRRSPSSRTRTHLTREDLYHAVKRLCVKAGVPVVSPHGLRGTFATVTVEIGVATDMLARNMGHGDGGAVARTSYIAPGAEQRRQGEQMGRLMFPQGVIDVLEDPSEGT